MRQHTLLKSLIYIGLSFLTLLVFYFSVNYPNNGPTSYNFFSKFTSPINAYLLDQLFFFLVFLFFLAYAIIKGKIRLNLQLVLIYFFLLVFLFIFQSEVLEKYFIKEDYYLILGNLNASLVKPEFDIYSVGFFKSYPYLSFVALFNFFHHDAYYYNLASLALMALSGILLYQFLSYLTPAKNATSKLILILLCLIYLVSPIIMEIYVWVQLGHSTGLIIAGLLISGFLYLRFVQTRDIYFFILNFLLILFLIKSALVRAAFWPFSLILLDLLYLPRKRERVNFLFRSFLLMIPLIFVTIVFPLKMASQVHYTVWERLYMFFFHIIPSIISYQFYAPAYKMAIYFLELHGFKDTFIYNNLLFILGIMTFVILSCTSLFLQRRGKERRIILFFWLTFISCLAFFTLFGNWGSPPIKGSKDLPLINYAEVPSSRYYAFTFLFFLITVYLLYITLYKNYYKKPYVLIAILLFVLVSNITVTQHIHKSMNETAAKPLKMVSEKILKLVPDEDTAKILYNYTEEPGVVKFLGFSGFSTLYKYPPTNIYSKNELIEYLKNNDIRKENIYAYSFDDKSLIFKDLSDQVRVEFKDYIK